MLIVLSRLQGVEVRHDPDEFSTDLGKNVTELTKYEKSLSPQQEQFQLVIIGGLSGRLDQTIHTLHALTQLVEKEGRQKVWAVGKESAACLLTKVSFPSIIRLLTKYAHRAAFIWKYS